MSLGETTTFTIGADGFRPFLEDTRTVPQDTVRLLMLVNEQLPVSERGFTAISNDHGEFNALDSNSGSVRETADKLSHLHTLDGTKIFFDDPSQTADLYFTRDRTKLSSNLFNGSPPSERIRFYTGPGFCVVRYILADTSPRTDYEWSYLSYLYRARSERLLVITQNEADIDLQAKDDQSMQFIKSILPADTCHIHKVVWKHKIGAHFDTPWKHYSAKIKNDDQLFDQYATGTKELLGVGDYIAMGITEAHTYEFTDPMSPQFGYELGRILLEGTTPVSEVLTSALGPLPSFGINVELEARGKIYNADAGWLAHSIVQATQSQKFGSEERKGILHI